MTEFRSVNPATGEVFGNIDATDERTIEKTLGRAAEAQRKWSRLSPGDRARLLDAAADRLDARVEENARLATREMGKPIGQSRAEIEKCARVCRHYAEHGPEMLADRDYASDGSRSYVGYRPLGSVLAIMPWNFPFWQLFRCAAPAMLAGNTIILKHAANVPQCAQAIQAVFDDAEFPAGCFQTLFVGGEQADELLDDERVAAVSLTGSTGAGSAVAGRAGRNIKKSVLELGGSDAFVVLPDADIESAVETGVTARYQNTGQSCIAAKRFILCDDIADEFVDGFVSRAREQVVGDPLDEGTDLGPMAREDLRDTLHEQAEESVRLGAKPVLGCEKPDGDGYFYPASVLDHVGTGMPAYSEETFGPLAAMIRVPDAETAIEVANDSDYGLGSSIWTADVERAEMFARRVQAGSTFINGMVKSDPGLPFGGVKDSGYGRELADLGLHEFVNAQTVWIA